MTSNTFKSRITLRFPRIERVRYDKPWHDCLTVKEFESIIKVVNLTLNEIITDTCRFVVNSIYFLLF